MVKRVEHFRLDRKGLSSQLGGRLTIPEHIRITGHILLSYVGEDLIPPDLDLFLLEDLNGFYHDVNAGSLPFSSTCRGIYVNEHSPWVPRRDYQKTTVALQERYGITARRALLLPQERVDYWTIVHEALHDIFANLSPEVRTRLVQAAASTYDTNGKFEHLLDLTHLNSSQFRWDTAAVAQRMNENRAARRSLLDGTDEFYTFQRLMSGDQLQVVDEFISNFFANDRGFDRWAPKHLHPSFKSMLREVGYNMDSPPEVMD
ncbi:hypothetical protein HYT55_05375 [Candidatus Woesearchaeota archaeon]|nr:hypothetical protein [Candidatus Woesearchaeota archaeon]